MHYDNSNRISPFDGAFETKKTEQIFWIKELFQVKHTNDEMTEKNIYLTAILLY